jgi:preprotein translocase subunit SecE
MARTTEAKLPPRPAQRPARVAIPRQWPPVIERVRRYFSEVWVELNRVEWPTRRELMSMTVVVLFVLVVTMIYLGSLDYLSSVLIKQWLLKQTGR